MVMAAAMVEVAMVEAAMVEAAMVEAETMAAARAAARAAAKAAGLWAPAADWPPGAPAVGGARLRWVAPRWRLRRRAGVPQAAPAAGDLRGACGGRSPAAAAAASGPPSGRRLRLASLRTVRRRAAPSAGGPGSAGGIAYLHRRIRQAGAERRGLALGARRSGGGCCGGFGLSGQYCRQTYLLARPPKGTQKNSLDATVA
jgi:hypothetical protein